MYFKAKLLLIAGFVIFSTSACVPEQYGAFSSAAHKRASHDVYVKSMSADNIAAIETEMATKGMSIQSPMLIRAFKSEMKLELWVKTAEEQQYNLFKEYNICKKSGSLGPKLKEGDMQTPEGFYDVKKGRLNPNSQYFLSFNIGFPNKYDRSMGRTGTHLMIHGDCVSAGCLAMTNESINEIYMIIEQNLEYGNESIPINIYPFRMTQSNMDFRRRYKWHGFWENLKQGYDHFEKYRRPAHATANNGRYVFNKGEYY